MKIQNQYLLIFIFFIALTFISCDQDDDKVELSKEGLTNYCELDIDGERSLLKDSFHLSLIRILGSSNSPQIFTAFGEQRMLRFEWDVKDGEDFIDVFHIISGKLIDETKGIDSDKLVGTINVDTFNISYNTNKALLVGEYRIEVILPDNSKKNINGKFRYDGEYESWF